MALLNDSSPHVGYRYVLDPGVARQLLEQEPHLRSLIKVEQVVQRITGPHVLAELMSGTVLNVQGRGDTLERGDLVPLSFNCTSYQEHRSRFSMPTWTAKFEAHGEFVP